MARVRTRGWRALGKATGNRRSSDGENGTTIWGGMDVVDSRGRGNLALMNLVGMESQGEGVRVLSWTR